MKCSNCGGDRIFHLEAKCYNQCNFEFRGNEKNGYVPELLNIGEDDDRIKFNLCMDCGHILGDFPVSDRKLSKAFGGPVWCSECCEEFSWPNELSRCRNCGKNLCAVCGGPRYQYNDDDQCKLCTAKIQTIKQN